jgi:hypothetical protein
VTIGCRVNSLQGMQQADIVCIALHSSSSLHHIPGCRTPYKMQPTVVY